MSVEGDEEEMEDVGESQEDFFDHEPSRHEKIEMRKAVKTPSEWLKLLCKEWAVENEVLVETTDAKFLDYKPYLKGLLTSQLLCRLSIPSAKDGLDGGTSPPVDFWAILGVADAFDRAYIVAQVERFCALYSIRAINIEDDSLFSGDLAGTDPASLAAAAAAGITVSPGGGIVPLPSYMDQSAAAAVAAAAAAATADMSKLSKKHVSEVSKAHLMAKNAEKALENERKLNKMREQRRVTQERKEEKAREREAQAQRKASERAAREASREERRRKKLEIRLQRENFAQQQKEAALQRAAELVASNRVPIEITRGAAAAKAVAKTAFGTAAAVTQTEEQSAGKKRRSAIVVSTASDLNQVVTHSKNLWAKYNAIAKEHNQKVNWTTVAKELGIHVKVREKYARMHSRAEQRGFDWEKCGDWKIKDHPEVFIEPTQAEQKAKMPPPPPDHSTTVLIEGNKEVTEEAVAAAAAVVDAAVNASVDAVVHTTEEQTAAAAAVAATLVADPTAGFVEKV